MSVCGHNNLEQPDQGSTPSHHSHISSWEQRAALEAITSQIIRYKTKIVSLERQQGEFRASLSLLVYPVLTLPTEITSRIFVQCLPTDGRVRPSSSTTPMVLTQICRQWRDVALATCELWSSIHIDRPYASGRGIWSLVETWLSRAKSHPISLGLDTDVPESLVALVSSFSEQIVTLRLGHSLVRQICQSDTKFPLLRRFVTYGSSHEDLQKLFQVAPSLCELFMFHNPSSVNFCLPSLTRFEIFYEISTETVLAILTHFPVLSHLRFNIPESDSSAITNTSIPAVFPHLSSLALCSPQTRAILHLLTLPNLHKLQLVDGGRADLDIIHTFLSRSSCTIDHLVISFWLSGADSAIPNCLKAFPSVAVLEIKVPRKMDSLIGYLTTSSLVPQLKDITIFSEIDLQTPAIDYEPLIKMLRSRMDSVKAVEIRKLHLVYDVQTPSYPSKWDYPYTLIPGYLAAPELERYITEGLDFIITFTKSCERRSYCWPTDALGES
ncbi:hypothetical protein FB451DRAFT_1287835 [Mycena latifolia]|nr:hypothetical protein FB451DRAFT_1287835 [Mycena latifolia]